MCRFAAYVGGSLPLAALLYEPPHSLEVQAYRPREMVSGHVNVDGTGVAWWRDGEAEPLSYRSELPPWSDANLPTLGARLRGSPILGVVRSQTPGMPAGVAAVHPFVFERWAGTHNGYVRGFDAIGRALIEQIDAELRAELTVQTDARVLFLIAIGHLRGGASLQEALVRTASQAIALCAEHGQVASLNLALAEAGQVVALRAAHGEPANSLYVLEGGTRWPGGRLIASEPLDDDTGWAAVAEDHVATISAEGVRVEPITL